jgi:hypothetical protein
MPKSTNTCNNLLALLYNATPWANIADNAAASPIATIQIALAKVTGAPTDTMSTNEADYTNYVRLTTLRATGAGGWTAPSGGAISNVSAITYAQCGVTGNTLVAAKTGKAAGASDVFHYGDLNAPIIVSNLIRIVFDPGAVTITEN